MLIILSGAQPRKNSARTVNFRDEFEIRFYKSNSLRRKGCIVMPRRLSGARVGGGGGGGGRDYGATVNSLESGGGSSLSTMARVIFFGAAAATATAAGVLAYRAHKR